ncbi:hypothetical protein IW140_002737 [Coemansia sp. RSA 1813]|nr:hypothetical protein EV178_003617 [Coemansia sp. RSA 1646]KAJ1769091.1 hypothetical protein LPJ74_004325 [Coemansia sp. RSA 1843]KAJ2569849.1 hypothetical protein IW140_002737 [Coemansia sp. RSA 1813]
MTTTESDAQSNNLPKATDSQVANDIAQAEAHERNNNSSDEMAVVEREEGERAQSPRSTRRIRNRLAAARMRTRQKQHLEELEQRKKELERRAAELEDELRATQSQNNPLTSSIDTLATMIDDLTNVEQTMLSGIDECKMLLQNLETLLKERNKNKQL